MIIVMSRRLARHTSHTSYIPPEFPDRLLGDSADAEWLTCLAGVLTHSSVLLAQG